MAKKPDVEWLGQKVYELLNNHLETCGITHGMQMRNVGGTRVMLVDVMHGTGEQRFSIVVAAWHNDEHPVLAEPGLDDEPQVVHGKDGRLTDG